jgi:uroporphyrinogen decarboxylase
MLDLMAEAKSRALGVDWRMDLARAWEMIGHDRACQGNLDPTVLLGEKSLIEQRVIQVLDAAQGRPGHIFNLGHGISKDTPVDNVKFLVDAVARHSGR